MIKIRSYPASKEKYGVTWSLSNIKYIVLHYTANDVDTSMSNAKYFASGSRGASAHYFVDSKNIVQSVKDNFVAWAVGGNKYNDVAQTGGGKFYGKCTNSNSLSIEICDDIKYNAIYPTEATINNVVELVRTLMKKYNINISNVIRHFDVTGKKCPMYWCGDSQKNAIWISIKNRIVEEEKVVKQSIKINGKLKSVDAINKGNYTYIKIRDLSDILNIEYDKETKLITLKVK
mgnify:FL=1